MGMVDRAHRLGAAHEQRSRTRAVTGLAGTLLLVHLLLGAVDLAAGLHLVLAAAALGKLPHHHALDQILARFQAEDGVVVIARERRGA